MTCPNCCSDDIEITHEETDGQGHYKEEGYKCNKCGCEWEWIMEMEITKKGKKVDDEDE